MARCRVLRHRVPSIASAPMVLVMILQVLTISGAASSIAADAANDPAASAVTDKTSSREWYEAIRENLDGLGYDTDVTNGVIGPRTRAALARFATDYKIPKSAYSQDDLPLILALFQYGIVAQAHPDLKELLGSRDFARWMNVQAGTRRKNLYTLLKDRPTQDIVILISEYKSEKKEPAPVPPSPPPEKPEAAAEDEKPLVLPGSSQGFITFKLTDRSLKALKARKVPPPLLAALKKLKDIEYLNVQLFRRALAKQIPRFAKDHRAYEALISAAAQLHRFDTFSSRPISWTGGPCGCVLDDLSGDVYGFYPFWLAGEEQQLDFSVLSRIGYFALPFDELGNIRNDLHWEKGKGGFIEAAARYRAWVDLVVYNDRWTDWQSFGPQAKSNSLQKLSKNIVALVSENVAGRSTLRWIHDSLPPWGGPSKAGGVTLYFAGYPEDEESVQAFIRFVRDTRRKLDAVNPHYALNILVPTDASFLAKGLYSARAVKQLIPSAGRDAEGYEGENYVDRFLVMLNAPTSLAARTLREKIEVENSFSAMQQRNVLRRLVPVITPDGYDEESLRNDLAYFEDNFGGVGLWPVQLIKNGEAQNGASKASRTAAIVNQALKVEYQHDHAKPVWGICKWMCPNRWAIRILWDMMILLVVVYALLSYSRCEWKPELEKYFLYVVGVFLAAVVIWLGFAQCDPLYRASKDWFSVAFVLAGIGYVLAEYIKKRKQTQFP